MDLPERVGLPTRLGRSPPLVDSVPEMLVELTGVTGWPAFQPVDGVNLPSLECLSRKAGSLLGEGERVVHADNEAIAKIKVAVAIIIAVADGHPVTVGSGILIAHTNSIVEVAGVCVVRVEAQPMGQATLKRHLSSMVTARAFRGVPTYGVQSGVFAVVRAEGVPGA